MKKHVKEVKDRVLLPQAWMRGYVCLPAVALTCASRQFLCEYVSQERALKWHQHQFSHLRGKKKLPWCSLLFKFDLEIILISSKIDIYLKARFSLVCCPVHEHTCPNDWTSWCVPGKSVDAHCCGLSKSTIH